MSSKKIIITLILISGIFSGCINSDPTSTNTDNTSTPSDQLKTYNNNQFAINFPSNWDVIQPKDFTSEIPAETQVVVRNNIKNDNFTSNVNVVRHNLQTEISSLDFAKEILNRQKTGLLDYKETKREISKISIGGNDQETYYVEFEARLNSTDPVTKFIQTYGTKDKFGYIIMAAHSLQEQSTVIDKLSGIIKSFKID